MSREDGPYERLDNNPKSDVFHIKVRNFSVDIDGKRDGGNRDGGNKFRDPTSRKNAAVTFPMHESGLSRNNSSRPGVDAL